LIPPGTGFLGAESFAFEALDLAGTLPGTPERAGLGCGEALVGERIRSFSKEFGWTDWGEPIRTVCSRKGSPRGRIAGPPLMGPDGAGCLEGASTGDLVEQFFEGADWAAWKCAESSAADLAGLNPRVSNWVSLVRDSSAKGGLVWPVFIIPGRACGAGDEPFTGDMLSPLGTGPDRADWFRDVLVTGDLTGVFLSGSGPMLSDRRESSAVGFARLLLTGSDGVELGRDESATGILARSLPLYAARIDVDTDVAQIAVSAGLTVPETFL